MCESDIGVRVKAASGGVTGEVLLLDRILFDRELFDGVSKGSADALKNRGPKRGANICEGMGTSGPDPNVAEYVGIGFSSEGKATFSMSEPYIGTKSSPGRGSWALTGLVSQHGYGSVGRGLTIAGQALAEIVSAEDPQNKRRES